MNHSTPTSQTNRLEPQAENFCRMLAAVVLRVLGDERQTKPEQSTNPVPKHRKDQE